MQIALRIVLEGSQPVARLETPMRTQPAPGRYTSTLLPGCYLHLSPSFVSFGNMVHYKLGSLRRSTGRTTYQKACNHEREDDGHTSARGPGEASGARQWSEHCIMSS